MTPMPMIDELRVGTNRPARDTGGIVDQRVVESRIRARRRWVLRTTLMLVLTAGILCLLVMWRRDETTVASCLALLDAPVSALQRSVEKYGWLPAGLPEPAAAALEGGYYASNIERFYAMNTSEPVIIAFGRSVPLILGRDGRGVIEYHQGKVSRKWLSLTGFQRAWLKQEEQMRAFQEKVKSGPPPLP